MEDKVIRFEFKGEELRGVADAEGNTWVIASPFAKRLGYANVSQAIRDNVEEKDRTTVDKIDVTISADIVRSQGGGVPPIVINRSGLVSLVLNSRNPEAVEFRHWVTAEVIPSIQDHGVYIDPAVDTPEARMTVVVKAAVKEAMKEFFNKPIISAKQLSITDGRVSLEAFFALKGWAWSVNTDYNKSLGKRVAKHARELWPNDPEELEPKTASFGFVREGMRTLYWQWQLEAIFAMHPDLLES